MVQTRGVYKGGGQGAWATRHPPPNFKNTTRKICSYTLVDRIRRSLLFSLKFMHKFPGESPLFAGGYSISQISPPHVVLSPIVKSWLLPEIFLYVRHCNQSKEEADPLKMCDVISTSEINNKKVLCHTSECHCSVSHSAETPRWHSAEQFGAMRFVASDFGTMRIFVIFSELWDPTLHTSRTIYMSQTQRLEWRHILDLLAA